MAVTEEFLFYAIEKPAMKMPTFVSYQNSNIHSNIQHSRFLFIYDLPILFLTIFEMSAFPKYDAAKASVISILLALTGENIVNKMRIAFCS